MNKRNADLISPIHARISIVTIAIVLLSVQAGCDASKTSSGTADASKPGLSEPSKSGGAGLTKVTLQLNWFPEVEHGGYYAALVHGYYMEVGLDVTILPGGPETPVLQQVARQAVTFGIINADNILFGQAQEVPAVAVMAALQTSPRCLIVHESSGIRNFEELKNMTIAMSTSAAFSHYLQWKVPLTGVEIVPYSGNVAQFLLNKNYAQQGYVFSEPFVARKQGGDPRVLMLADLGFNPYTSLLFTDRVRIDGEPDLVRKMVAASVRGWKHYIEAPDKTNEYIHQVNPEMDLDILAFGAKTLAPLVQNTTDPQPLGAMSLARWKTLADQLTESGQLKPNAVQVERAFTTSFLPSP